MSFLPLVRLWILTSAFAGASGWVLSATGQLNVAGYGVCGGIAAVLAFCCPREFPAGREFRPPGKFLRRFRRPLPLVFGILVFLAFLGGVLYAPGNYDALTYRLPRVLNWLAHGQWHWIHSTNYRMNDRTCGFEWLTAPILLLTKSDRGLFLINFISLLLLPGLVFSVFTRLGVNPRVSWHWMWLLPTGYNFLLQAGSIANDTFAAVYALAAVDFALRAQRSRRPSDLWLSLLAAALLTGAKLGNLPLLLPWLVLFVPLLPRLREKPLVSLAVFWVAALASFIPTAVLNGLNCGDWTGAVLERAGITTNKPLIGILGNSAMVLTANFVPPFFPLAGWWNHSILSLLPAGISAPLTETFEPGFHALGEMPTEEMSGMGFGLSVLLLVSILAAWRLRGSRRDARDPRSLWPSSWQRRLVLITPFVALLVFFSRSGMMTVARLVSAYYPLLVPALVAGAGHALLVRRRWWRTTALAVMLLAVPVVVLTPARPLWPAATVLSKLQDRKPQDRWVARARNVYAVYAERPDALATIRAHLPAEISIIGFVGTDNDPDISLWRPFGSRRVEHILPDDTSRQIRERKIRYVVVLGRALKQNGDAIEAWLARYDAEWLASEAVTLTVSEGAFAAHVVRLR